MKKKILKRSCFLITVFFLSKIVVLGQVVQDHEGYFKKALYKSEAPNAWGFSDFSKEGSVDVSTGRFGLTIPFTTIEDNFLSLPIKLTYSTGGIKLRENASEVGMGWNLVAGGSVTRILKGVPDEIAAQYLDISGGRSGIENLFTGKIVPSRYANGYIQFKRINSLVTKYYRGAATRGYQNSYSRNFPKPVNADYYHVLPNDYLGSSIMQMQSDGTNVENESDIFHVSVGDINFNFILKIKDESSTALNTINFYDVNSNTLNFEAVPLDDKDIKIEILYGKINNYWYEWMLETDIQPLKVGQEFIGGITGFIITDKKGVKYYFQDYAFTEPEYVKTFLDHSSQGTNYERTIQYVLRDVQINDWELTQIILPDGKNLNFDYTKQRTVEQKLVPRQHDGEYTGHPYNLTPQKPPYAIENVNFGKEKLYLNRIRTDNLSIKFNYDTNLRTDLQNGQRLISMQLFNDNNSLIKEFDFLQQYYGQSTSNNYETTRMFLTNIIEKNILIRKPPFTYNNSEDIGYSFDYYNPDSLPGKNTIGYEDLYGYYLGNTVENAYPPFPKLYVHAALEGTKINYYPIDTDTFIFNGAERRPNSNTVHYGTLKTVTFPTKGSLEIAYEPNKFFEDLLIEKNANGPGCRVSQVKYYSGTNNLEKIKRYNYTSFDNSNESSGVLMYKPSFAYISNYAIDNAQDLGIEQTKTYYDSELGWNVFLKYTKSAEQLNIEGLHDSAEIIKKLITTSTHPLGHQCDIFGREILYKNVQEEDVSTADNSLKGKTKYYNYYIDNRPEVNVVSGPTNEATYIPPLSQNVYKTFFTTAIYPTPWCCDHFVTDQSNGHTMVKYGYVEKKGKDIFPFPDRNYFSNDDALKIGKTYKIEYWDNNNKVQEKNYNYTRLNNSSYKTLNFSLGYLDTFYYSSAVGSSLRLEIWDGGGRPMLQGNAGLYFYAIDNLYTNQKLVLQNEEAVDYSANGAAHTTKEYEYNNLHLDLTAEKSIFPDNTKIRKTYQYSEELRHGNQPQQNLPPYQSLPYMISQNMIGIPLISTSYKNDIFQKRNQIIYQRDPLTHYILPQKNLYYTEDKTIVSPSNGYPSVILPDPSYAVTEVTYDQYDDKGNLLQYTTKDNLPTAIIWGYNDNYPIAKIEGATYMELVTLDGGILTAASIDNTLETQASEDDLLAALDTFRKKPELSNYQITTYTYDPLVGVTSITPPSGVRQVYIYDTANRLKEVRENNQTGNLLKEYQYHYKP